MKFVQTQDKLARRLQSTLQCTRLFWILPFSLQSTRVAEWLSSETTFVKGVGGERLLPFTPLFSADQRCDTINDKLYRKGGENDAKQARNHRAPGNAHCL